MTSSSTSRADLDGTLAVLTRLIAAIQDNAFDAGRTAELVAAVRARPHLATLPMTLFKAYNEIAAVLSGIRITRETIEHQTVDRLRDTHEKLSQVSDATESAAMEIMNGLDRTLGFLDRLEAAPGRDGEGLEALRGEVNQLFDHLQFQDITTQNLRGVTSLLTEVEERIARVADLLDQSLAPQERPRIAPDLRNDADTYNPDAEWSNAAERQVVADAAFKGRRGSRLD